MKSKLVFTVTLEQSRIMKESQAKQTATHSLILLSLPLYALHMPYQQQYTNKIILVTGGAGAIGTNLIVALSKLSPKKIIILDDLSSSYEWNIPACSNVLFVKGDIRNDNDLKRVFRHKPTIVFHLASFFANQNSIDYPLINEDVNVVGIIKLLEYCVIAGNIERFIYTNSEGGAYGSDCEIPYEESQTSLRLSSPYYISKMAGEAYCNFYHSQYALNVSIVRLFNSYGPGEVPGQYRNVIPNFIYWALNNQQLPLTGDAEIARDFVYVTDIVEGILRAGYFPEAIGVPINIATGIASSIYDLAELINVKIGNAAGVKIIGQRKWDTRKVIVGNNARCKKILRFEPSVSMTEGIENTIKWFRNNMNEIEKETLFQKGINPALDLDPKHNGKVMFKQENLK